MTARSLMHSTGVSWRASDRTPTIVLLTGATAIAAHRAFGTMESAMRFFPEFTRHEAVLFMIVSAGILFGVLPAFAVRVVFRERLRDYGVRWGDWRVGMKTVAISIPVISAALLWPAAHTGEMRAWFPLDPSAGTSAGAFVAYQLVRAAIFYAAWEFFFRGFMLFGLRGSVGDWQAILIQTIPSCLWHIGMPLGELFSSIAGGVLFGVIAIRTRSIVWPLALHVAIGVITDLFIVLT